MRDLYLISCKCNSKIGSFNQFGQSISSIQPDRQTGLYLTILAKMQVYSIFSSKLSLSFTPKILSLSQTKRKIGCLTHFHSIRIPFCTYSVSLPLITDYPLCFLTYSCQSYFLYLNFKLFVWSNGHKHCHIPSFTVQLKH